MDFGLFLPEFRFARADLVAGSPPYMAAEALTGDLEPGSGPLVDIHALGVTAFELLAGDLPRTANSLPELYEVHLAPPPSLRDFRKDVPDGLVKLVDEMLSFEPGDRPQSVESIAWRLAAVLDEKPPAEAHGIEKVLIVDDDEDIAKLEKFYVTRTLGSDVQVRVAKDGEEAIAAVAEFEPDVMLLDLHMPKLNGIEVAMYMRGSHVAESCTIVLVSAGAQEHDRQLLNQLGIRHFLVKGGELGKQLGELLETLSG
jgi:CheY-like chemotaxis protein